MARVVYQKRNHDHYEFRLSNKPEYLFFCDLEDFYLLESGSWYVHISKRKGSRPYIRKTIYPSMVNIHFHRFIKNAGDFTINNIVDHFDCNTLDNRKANLRIVDYKINALNKEKTKYVFTHKETTFTITQVNHSSGKIRFQTYINKKFIASSFDLEIVKARVIKFLNERAIHDETKEPTGRRD